MRVRYLPVRPLLEVRKSFRAVLRALPNLRSWSREICLKPALSIEETCRTAALGHHEVGSFCGRGDTGAWPFDRFRTSFIVNWLADLRALSSFHSSGSATGAPGRARTA